MGNFDKFRKTAETCGYELVHGQESHGDNFFGLMILVKMSNRKYDCERDSRHLYRIGDAIRKGFDTVTAELDPKGAETRASYRREIEQIYADAGVIPVFMEPLPNGYCGDPCCINRPWFRVTSSIGHVVIGWRKSVMSIDWKDSIVKKTGDELFPDEAVTRSERGIHAWGGAKASEYIRRLHAEVK